MTGGSNELEFVLANVLLDGMRADLVRIRVYDDLPVVRQVWRAGERVI